MWGAPQEGKPPTRSNKAGLGTWLNCMKIESQRMEIEEVKIRLQKTWV
jgi:hypothetical protein